MNPDDKPQEDELELRNKYGSEFNTTTLQEMGVNFASLKELPQRARTRYIHFYDSATRIVYTWDYSDADWSVAPQYFEKYIP